MMLHCANESKFRLLMCVITGMNEVIKAIQRNR
jgi:hypothetical protein